jgi:hypothetical protein
VHWLEFLIVVSLQEWLEPDVVPQPPKGAPPEHLTDAVAASMGLSTLPAAAGKGAASGSSSSTSALTQAGVVVVFSVSGVTLRCGSCYRAELISACQCIGVCGCVWVLCFSERS